MYQKQNADLEELMFLDLNIDIEDLDKAWTAANLEKYMRSTLSDSGNQLEYLTTSRNCLINHDEQDTKMATSEFWVAILILHYF